MTVIEPSSAYFDESRLDANFPVVAGFWNTVDVWAVCEAKLREELRGKPEGLAAKKYVRANSLKFAQILRSFTLHPISATVEKRVYGSLWRQKGNEPLFANAYTSCCFSCCEMLDNYGLQQGWKAPIKVVFDDGAEGKALWERSYRKYYERHKAKSLLSKIPDFADDEETLPLLGADLYAWLLSRKFNGEIAGEEAEALKLVHSDFALSLILDDKQARRIQA